MVTGGGGLEEWGVGVCANRFGRQNMTTLAIISHGILGPRNHILNPEPENVPGTSHA